MRKQLETPSQVSNLRFVLDELKDFKTKSETQTPIDFARLDKVIQVCAKLTKGALEMIVNLELAKASLESVRDVDTMNELRVANAWEIIKDSLEVLHREGEEE